MNEEAEEQRSTEAAPAEASKTLPIVLELAEKIGSKIGRYKLLQQIGEGGCGVVYMAEQEEPVKRRVALKVIKPGMDSKQVLARFEAERQALALMEHPNIAKVLDAGATEAGRPFFVMELVRGIRITAYCDQNNLRTETRLDLFAQVCRAVQHAHQKGIIHRDIKPSNILVTLHDGVPVPKLIDFGIAKATSGQELTDRTLFTAFEQFIGTPAYMSPEQAEMSGLDIDTRSDIYSLGVLLYELLTGNTPFDAQRLAMAGVDEKRRIIREEEPPSPSTRLSTLDATEQTSVAKHRQCEVPKLVHLIRGDLDWIVMRALEKDRTRRYPTASELALDIGRFLSNEPVLARPPSTLYRLVKLARRNKGAFVTASAVTAALLIGLGVSTWLFLRERKTARAAQAAALQSRLSSEVMGALFSEMLRVPRGGNGPRPWDLMDKSLERLEQSLDQPDTKARVLATRGRGYLQLNEFERAEAMQTNALALRHQAFGNRHPDVSESLSLVAEVLYREGDLEGAARNYSEALKLENWKPWITSPTLMESSLYNFAEVLHRQHKDEEAEEFLDRMTARASRDNSQSPVLFRARGMYHARRKNWPKAAEDLSRAVQSDPFQMGNSYLLAVLLVQAERYSEYQDLCDRVLARSESATPDAARRNAKTCLLAAPREQALPRIEKLVEAALSAPGPFFKLASTVKGLLEYREKHYAEAQKFLQEAVGMNGPQDPAMEAQPRLVLAMACAELKQTEEARKNLAEAEKLTQGIPGRFEEMGRDYEERLWVESLTNEILLREARALVQR